MKNARRIARKPTLVGLGQLGIARSDVYSNQDPDHHDVFLDGRGAQPASRHKWSHPEAPFRVHYYDPSLVGTWHQYFGDYDSARAFAVTRRLYGRPCEVERRS